MFPHFNGGYTQPQVSNHLQSLVDSVVRLSVSRNWYIRKCHPYIFASSSFNISPTSSTPPALHVCPHLPVPPLRPRVHCRVVSHATCVPDASRGQGNLTNIRMGLRHLRPIPPGCRALRSLLDICPLCGRYRSRVNHRTLVCFVSRCSQ